MEVACEIIRKKNSSIPHNATTKVVKKLLELIKPEQNGYNGHNGMDIASPNKFLEKITSLNVMKIADSLAEALFDNNKRDIGYSIVFAYYISTFHHSIFGQKRSRTETKLTMYANQVVSHIEEFNRLGQLRDEFYESFDHYYSLYKTWISQESLQDIDEYFDEMVEQLKGYKMKLRIKKVHDKKLEADIISTLEKMLNKDSSFAIKTLLTNYDLIRGYGFITKHIWEKVSKEVYRKNDSILLIMVAELRISIIPQLKESKDRKDIYYKIDTEEMVKKIRNNDFTQKDLASILDLISTKVKKFNPSFNKPNLKNLYKGSKDKWTRQYCNSIVSIFKSLFDAV